MAAPVSKGMGGVTLVLLMFVCGALSFGVPSFQPSLRLGDDGRSTCNSGNEKGVCYDPLNCLKVTGTFGNKCPDAQGVCCLFYRQCGQESAQEVSYFRNTDKGAGPGCNYRVVKRSSNYCGMRVNLEQLDIPDNCQTSLNIEGVAEGKKIGKLRFPERSDSERICRSEAGIEYAFDTHNISEILVNVESSGGITGKWKIKVTQVQCADGHIHEGHIPAVWPPPIITHPPPTADKPTTQSWQTPRPPTPTTQRPSTATCWWNCDTTTRRTTRATRPTTQPTRPPVTDSSYSQCGVRGPNGPNGRSDIQDILNIRTRNTVQGESSPFVTDLDYGNPTLNETVLGKVVQAIHQKNMDDNPFLIPNIGVKITFGKPSGPREYPWQVGMKVRGRFHCGASIIGDQHILTAAHCVTKYRNSPRTLYLTLGDWDLSDPHEQANVVPTVERVTVHPQYSRTTLRNDLAVLKLTKKIQFGPNIRPVCLAPPGFETTSKYAIVTGWGRDENNRLMSKLHELASEVVSNTYCARQWELNGAPSGFITKDMMCMSPIGGDSCNGDSGGPSVVEIGGIQHQVGIVSFGSGSCVDPDLPGVYTRVTSYRDWILAQMN